MSETLPAVLEPLLRPPPPDEKRCSVVRDDGERCRAYRAKSDPEGRCSGHAGMTAGQGIARDPAGYARKSNATRRRHARLRRLVGLNGKRVDPIQLARALALTDPEPIVEALYAPIHANGLSPLQRQTGAVTLLDKLYGQERGTDESGARTIAEVRGLSTKALEALIARLPLPDVIEGEAIEEEIGSSVVAAELNPA